MELDNRGTVKMTHDIKALRLAQSMSQKRLAHEAGIDVRTLRRIESGVAVSPESYRSVCLALKVEPNVPSAIPLPPASASDVSPAARRFDDLVRKATSLSRRRSVRVITALALILSAGSAAYAYMTRPNVSVSIAFDRACGERGVWSKAFKAMDREFPNGYIVADRIDAAKGCEYRFEAYLNRTDSLRDDMFASKP